MNINYKNILIIIIVSLLSAFVFNLYKNNLIFNFYSNKKDDIASKNLPVEKNKVIRLINSSEAIDFFNKNDAIFIDARDPWEFSDSHIFNSINIPEYNFNPNNPILNALNKDGIYITYCSATDCDLSRRLATKLKAIGFKNVFVYSEGFERWVELRYPIFRK